MNDVVLLSLSLTSEASLQPNWKSLTEHFCLNSQQPKTKIFNWVLNIHLNFKQIPNIYCFQMQLDFSFNLILERKHLIHFSAFISHVYVYKLKSLIHWRLVFGNAKYKLFYTSNLNLSILNLHLCSLNGCF